MGTAAGHKTTRQPPAAQRHAGPVVKRPVPITQNTKQEAHKMQYYEINEQTARRANDVNSMSDYRPGSATEEYRAAVDKAAALVQARKSQDQPLLSRQAGRPA